MSESREEVVISQYRRSVWTGGFWWRMIVTLGLYLYLWNRNKITLTNRRIVERRGGILGGEEISLNLARITDIRVKTGPLGAILKHGLFEVQSAGSDSAEISFEGLSHPHKLKDQIYDLQDGSLDGDSFSARTAAPAEGQTAQKADEAPVDE
ncbi:MAG: PH domain-containing protein [Chloroflexi bacterium]|nr:PH domain-containing protein [Chloroflexota bacterium]